MDPQRPAFHNQRVPVTRRELGGRSWRDSLAVQSSWDSLALGGCSVGPRPRDTDRQRGSLAPEQQHWAARKSDRRTVRALQQLLAVVVAVAVAEVVAVAWRARASAASPGTG